MPVIVEQPSDFTQEKQKPLPGETLRQYLDRHQAHRKKLRKHIKAKRRKPKRRRPTTEAMRWLKDKIFCHVYGEKVGDGVFPSMKKKPSSGSITRGSTASACRITNCKTISTA